MFKHVKQVKIDFGAKAMNSLQGQPIKTGVSM
jgi:hypothetical protein